MCRRQNVIMRWMYVCVCVLLCNKWKSFFSHVSNDYAYYEMSSFGLFFVSLHCSFFLAAVAFLNKVEWTKTDTIHERKKAMRTFFLHFQWEKKKRRNESGCIHTAKRQKELYGSIRNNQPTMIVRCFFWLFIFLSCF